MLKRVVVEGNNFDQKINGLGDYHLYRLGE